MSGAGDSFNLNLINFKTIISGRFGFGFVDKKINESILVFSSSFSDCVGVIRLLMVLVIKTNKFT